MEEEKEPEEIDADSPAASPAARPAASPAVSRVPRSDTHSMGHGEDEKCMASRGMITLRPPASTLRTPSGCSYGELYNQP